MNENSATPNFDDEQSKECLPCKVRTFLYATGLFILLGLVVTSLAAVFVNHLKNELVQIAEMEIRDLHNKATLEMTRLIDNYEAEGEEIHCLSQIAQDPEIQAQFRLLSNQSDVVMTALIGADGSCVLQYGEEEKMVACPDADKSAQHASRNSDQYRGLVPGQEEDLSWDFKVVQFPEGVKTERVEVLSSNNKTVGFVEFGIEPSAALQKLSPISNSITKTLYWMIGVGLSFFGLAMFALYRAGNQQVDLQRQYDKSRHLATIGTMASGLAHEIRNPLHAMNLHLEAAKEEIEDPREDSMNKVGDTISNVQRQIINLNGLVSNFMNFGNPGRMEMEPLVLDTLVSEVLNLLGPDLNNRNVNVSHDICPDYLIKADVTAARQVIMNIILNAAQAMDQVMEPEITIRSIRKENKIRILFEDSGPGIPEEKISNIFELFMTEKKGGSGFGLAIARRIMEAHQGNIWAENRKEGGARFVIEFLEGKPDQPRSKGKVDQELLDSDYEDGYIG